MKMMFRFIGLLILVIMAACKPTDNAQVAAPQSGGPQAATSQIVAISLTFQEEEQGIEPYLTRSLVTAGHLRMDEGRDEGDFLLFDRRDGTIYSVTHQDQTILKIMRRPVDIEPPSSLIFGQDSKQDAMAPRVDGKTPVQHTLSANGEPCYNVIAVEGMLDDVRLAMRDYLQTLAGEQAANLDKTPFDMQTPCMLANLIYKPTQHLDYGFPIAEWDYRGYRRTLLDYKMDVIFDGELFQVPQAYRVISLTPEGVVKQDS